MSGIPYRNVTRDPEQAAISGAFFRSVPSGEGSFVGGLLVLDGRGEPMEFVYNQVSARNRIFWRDRDLVRATTRELLASLFDACQRRPSAIFCLANEVAADVLMEDLDVARPLARVAPAGQTIGGGVDEEVERVEGAGSVQLFWVRGRPSEATEAHRLVEELAKRGLLLEPFDRVTAGLREVYGGEVEDDDGST